MMTLKNLAVLSLMAFILLIYTSTFAVDEASYEYIELGSASKPMSTTLRFTINKGDASTIWEPIKENGEYVEAKNHLFVINKYGKEGWEWVDSYLLETGLSKERVYVLRRKL